MEVLKWLSSNDMFKTNYINSFMIDVIKKELIAKGHGDRDNMAKEIRKKYGNITDDISLRLSNRCAPSVN